LNHELILKRLGGRETRNWDTSSNA